ncbi:MAG: hypothetical protein AAGF47_12350 [Planctomycetota bacterium]
MEFAEIIETLADGDNILWLVGGTIAIVAIVVGGISKVLRTFANERTRRDVAAYIAEGSMTPEQGEKLLKAGKRSCG